MWRKHEHATEEEQVLERQAGNGSINPKMNENNPKVALTNEQRETLAGTLDIFAEALRERRELRVRDFQDIADEVRHFQQSPNPSQLGSRLDRMTIFFDNVFRIPPNSQGGKFCIACGSQATYVKLDGDGVPLAFHCDDHVFEARR
jgi:hypothetical protein